MLRRYRQVRQWGLTSIHTCRSYVHPPRDIGAMYSSMCALADSPADFGLLGEQSSQKWEIPCLGRWWTTLQNFTPLALSSAKKSVTVQTNKKHKQQTIYPHHAYRHGWIKMKWLKYSKPKHSYSSATVTIFTAYTYLNNATEQQTYCQQAATKLDIPSLQCVGIKLPCKTAFFSTSY